jgi:2-polyprenyl-6-methoxyphenol hydroxylase-like FAD-dependent oxidoreductase
MSVAVVEPRTRRERRERGRVIVLSRNGTRFAAKPAAHNIWFTKAYRSGFCTVV